MLWHLGAVTQRRGGSSIELVGMVFGVGYYRKGGGEDMESGRYRVYMFLYVYIYMGKGGSFPTLALCN